MIRYINTKFNSIIELLEYYNYICEYNSYKKYKDKLDGKQFDFKQIEENYRKAIEKYKPLLPAKNKKELNSIFNMYPMSRTL